MTDLLRVSDLAPPPGAAAAAPAASTAPVDAAPRFVGDRARVKTIALDWPVEFGGKIYEKIILKRLTVAEVSAFIDTLEGGKARFPIFVDEDGAAIPGEVMEALDDDDGATIDKESLDFLPRRFREASEEKTTDSRLTTGDSAAPSSAR
jgi:hypothetical protein